MGGAGPVTVGNEATALVDVRVTTSIGEHKLMSVPAGTTWTVAFMASEPGTATGTSVVKAFARVAGGAHERSWTIAP